MDYTDEEHNIINKRKNILQLQYDTKYYIEKELIKLKKINTDDLNDKEYREYKKKFIKYINKLCGVKSAITKHKKIISKIVNNYLYDIDNNLLVLIIEFLQDIKFINMITATKHIYNLYIQEGNYNIIYIYNSKYNTIYNTTYKIPKELLYAYDINLEQLFYVPITKEGRTLIHIIVRNNHLNIMKYLLQKYEKLNINVGTIVENWRPIHDAIHDARKFGFYDMVKLLVANHVNYNVKLSTKLFGNLTNIDDIIKFTEKYTKRSTLYQNIYNYLVYHSDYIFDGINIEKNEINYKDIGNNKYIMNLLIKIIDDIKCMSPKNIHMNII